MLDSIKGIGPKTIKLLNKLGINDIESLVTYYPYRYDILKRSNINELEDNDKIIVDGVVENIPSIFHFNRRMDKMTFRLNTGSYLMNITIFNRGFMRSKLTSGTKIIVIGKYEKKKNSIIASEIRFGILPSIPIIEPVYHTTNGITSKLLNTYIKEVYDINLKSYIPDYLIEKYNFLDKNECIKEVHNPKDINKLKNAFKYLKYEELFLFMLKMNNLKLNRGNNKGIKRTVEYNQVLDFINKLPFQLTDDQMKSVKVIYDDLMNIQSMNRLLQGDVGSGKTIVAIISLYINYLSGYQGVLMAPTEVLASQHYNNITSLFKDYNINVKLLTCNIKSKERKELLKELKDNKIDILIGTHALFSDDVIYNNLGLVITDEQHRFGVNQRSSLKNKGITPDILYLSATPIPRTYALTIYGDMDISSIKTMPNGRLPVKTILKSDKDIKEVLALMYEEIKKNHQIYVIAPLIEESDKSDLENVNELYDKLTRALGKVCTIGIMHGKMSNTDKEQVMNDFKDNKIQILISTTVIEVGVDVKNATMIVIFDSYRFGLSQLHQLRGRVGRNSEQSYCILISNKEKERLKIMTETTDGFKISEEDFRLRGSGDLFGVRQSGDMSFQIANIKQDFNILVKAKEDSLDFINSKAIDKQEFSHIKEILYKSTNLD